MNKGTVKSMQRELTRSRSYHASQISWRTIGELYHQKQHKCKDCLNKNIIGAEFLVILTIYSTIVHIVLSHKYISREKNSQLTVVSEWPIYVYS